MKEVRIHICRLEDEHQVKKFEEMSDSKSAKGQSSSSDIDEIDGDSKFQENNANEFKSEDTLLTTESCKVHGVCTQPSRNYYYRYRYKCPYCFKELSRPGKICKHIADVHQKPIPPKLDFNCSLQPVGQHKQKQGLINKRDFNCQTCGKTFTHNYKLRAHTSNVHTKDKRVSCIQCGISVASNYQLKLHIAQVHLKIRNFSCVECNKAFKTKAHLVSHEQLHVQEKPYSCTICEKKFTKLDYLKSHKIIHSSSSSNELPFTCGYCTKTFRRKNELVCHTRIHTKEKPYHCNLCGRNYATNSDLKSHSKVHTSGSKYGLYQSKVLLEGEEEGSSRRWYVCEYCQRHFKKSFSLNRHIRTHTMEKPFLCKICSKAFSDKASMVKHQSVHSTDRNYKCELCNKTFKYVSNLNRHKDVHSQETYPCPLCNTFFNTKRVMKAHIRIHTNERLYKCEICSRAWYNKSDLNQHQAKNSGDKSCLEEVE